MDMSELVLAFDSGVASAPRVFWTVVFTAGVGSFYVLVLLMIPLGLRDLFRLLARLNRPDDGQQP